MGFLGKSVLVVGGTSGIGRASALRFAKEGARVVLTGRRADAGAAVVADIEAKGGAARFVAADIRSAHDCARMVDATVEFSGQIDIAFNNSGILPSGGTIAAMDEADWDEVMAVNLKGYFLAMKEELRIMLPQRSGTIVNMASICALEGSPGLASYVASKHGVAGLTRTAALDHIKDGIRINAICPGGVDTEMTMTATLDPESAAAHAAFHPIGRQATAEEIAAAVLAVAADDMSFMVGAMISVDGGVGAGR